MARSKPKVLLVEDDGDVALVMQLVLEERFNVVWADSLEKALSHLEREVFEAVVLDWHIGHACGRDLLARVAVGVNTSSPTIVVTTGSTDERVLKEAIELGAAQILQKPFPLDDLLHAVAQALAERATGHSRPIWPM